METDWADFIGDVTWSFYVSSGAIMFCMPRSPAISLLSRIWPLLFVAFAAAALLYGLKVVASIAMPASQSNPQYLQWRLDEIRWSLQIVVIAAGLFASAQAGFSYFSAQAFTKQAEDTVKRIETLREELESRFPSFMEAERMEKEATRTLEELGKVADWRGSYESLDFRRRQRLLTVDSWVAMDLRSRVRGADAYGRSLYRMGQLYASKYKYNKSAGGGSVGDVERAEYYLTLASDNLGETHYLLNELGLLYLEFYEPRDPETLKANQLEAERLFKKSLLNKSDQQRAHYNLGVLAAARRNWHLAVECYEQALKFSEWEDDRRPEMECNVVYNAACAWARMNDAAKVVNYLNKTAKLGYVETKTVDRDYIDPDGDFFEFLRGTDEQTRQMATLRTKLSKTVAEPQNSSAAPNFLRRLNNAFKALTADS
jgi:tetratricopeptide (TPR) repeat protein